MASVAPLAWAKHDACQAVVFTAKPMWCTYRCSLLFVGALDELQHFIWSLGWIGWGKFRCKAPRVCMFGSTILSPIKADRIWYKSISPYDNLEMFIIGYVFIEESLVGSSDSCFGALTSVLPTLVDQALIMASAKDCNAPRHNKLKTKCPNGPRGCLTQVPNSRDLSLETSSWHDFFSSAMYIWNVVIEWRCLSNAALCISL